MKMPLIGITTSRTNSASPGSRICLNEVYSAAISRSGAVPVLIPLGLPFDQLEGLLDRIDGILFSGGGDAHPTSYGSQMHPKVDDIDEDRDRVEIFLAKQTILREKPFLGICRGLQVVNIACGGTLFEDILDQRPGSLQHQTPEDLPRDYHAHTVRVEPGSRLGGIMAGEALPVNSHHHQAVRILGNGLSACAFAPDGIIEGFELPDYPFGLAVQWHPEWLPKEAHMQSIFLALHAAAKMQAIQSSH